METDLIIKHQFVRQHKDLLDEDDYDELFDSSMLLAHCVKLQSPLCQYVLEDNKRLVNKLFDEIISKLKFPK